MNSVFQRLYLPDAACGRVQQGRAYSESRISRHKTDIKVGSATKILKGKGNRQEDSHLQNPGSVINNTCDPTRRLVKMFFCLISLTLVWQTELDIRRRNRDDLRRKLESGYDLLTQRTHNF